MGALGAAAFAPRALAQVNETDRALAQGGRGIISARDLGWDPEARRYILPELRYAYDALEPHIDAATMEIHHSRHHAGYVSGLNKALDELAKIRKGEGDAGLIKHWSREVSFHGGGHVNHTLFWLTMGPKDFIAESPSLELLAHMERDFGSMNGFWTHFEAAANAVEGSGWAWLVYEPNAGRLLITQMEKQQDLWMTGAAPLLGVDVWEHAYYLRYQNRRGDYVKAFRNVVNWAMVDELFAIARGV
ncbi:MAG: superoxide dismutase [Phycisphaerales bacterium]|nr:MAG: superoxide dismutase [Phycisphaerales bacterium]